MALQAALQHVVLTYDPINGRQIYVNGVNQNLADPHKGGTISNWDSTFALVLGSEVSGDNAFQGEIKFLAIHSRALSAAQVHAELQRRRGPALLPAVQRLERAGRQREPGVHHVHGEPVRQLQLPVLSADLHLARSAAKPTSIPLQGMRIGINGTIPLVGQAYIPLNMTITAANYTSQGEVLSNVGTVIGLESGPPTDQFFLQFDLLGTAARRDRRGHSAAARPWRWVSSRRPRTWVCELRASELDLRPAHGCADHQRGGGHHLPERPAAAPR